MFWAKLKTGPLSRHVFSLLSLGSWKDRLAMTQPPTAAAPSPLHVHHVGVLWWALFLASLLCCPPLRPRCFSARVHGNVPRSAPLFPVGKHNCYGGLFWVGDGGWWTGIFSFHMANEATIPICNEPIPCIGSQYLTFLSRHTSKKVFFSPSLIL